MGHAQDVAMPLAQALMSGVSAGVADPRRRRCNLLATTANRGTDAALPMRGDR
jgi:hypothetical protein